MTLNITNIFKDFSEWISLKEKNSFTDSIFWRVTQVLNKFRSKIFDLKSCLF